MDDLFDYSCDRPVSIGQYVVVPFAGRQLVGIVVDITDSTNIDPKKLKKIIRVDEEVLFDKSLFQLFRFVSKYYIYPIGQTIHTALPTKIRKDADNKKPPLYQYSPSLLLTKNYIDTMPAKKRNLKKLALAILNGSINDINIKEIIKTPKQYIQELMAINLIHREEFVQQKKLQDTESKILNTDQQQVVANILKNDGFYPWLIYGITGSGKTEVYMALIDEYLKQAGQVLVMVPEINLTPQLEERFRKRFAMYEIVSLHSHLSDSERLDNWRRAKSGEAQIVIGTRLSVFTPFKSLRAIIIDEEHDASYKQQDRLRYHAKDVAMMRAKLLNIPYIAGSATPSLESWYLTKNKKLQLVRLPKRASKNATLPSVRLIQKDIKQQNSIFSDYLIESITNRLEKKEQTIIFINRRGYAPVLFCASCTWSAHCKLCSSPLVVHKKTNQLRCHHCDYRRKIHVECEQCGNIDLMTLGQGTQRVEEILMEYFPLARIKRVDRDTIKTKKDLDKLYEAMLKEEIDILVGTQMLSKGHDFPKLTLVGVIDPDHALFSHDFRASEKLFSQLVQVAGRSGRDNIPGEVLIQTNFSKHPLYDAVRSQNYESFADEELALRKALSFPPFVHHSVLKVESKWNSLLQTIMSELYDIANLINDSDVRIHHPARPFIDKVNGMERAHMFMESHSRIELNQFLIKLKSALIGNEIMKKVRFYLEVDPIDI